MAQRQAETDGNACRELRPSRSDVVRWRRTSEVRVSLQESITPEFRAFYPRGTFKLSQLPQTNQLIELNQVASKSRRVAPITCVDRVAIYFLILLTTTSPFGSHTLITSRTTTYTHNKNSPAPSFSEHSAGSMARLHPLHRLFAVQVRIPGHARG
jgi:hypothetical protein